MVRLVDQVPVGDRLVVETAEGLHRRPGPLGRVQPERLDRVAAQEPRGGDDLGQGDTPLASPSVDADFGHRTLRAGPPAHRAAITAGAAGAASSGTRAGLAGRERGPRGVVLRPAGSPRPARGPGPVTPRLRGSPPRVKGALSALRSEPRRVYRAGFRSRPPSRGAASISARKALAVALRPLFKSSYRLVGYSALVGLFGAFAAIAFNLLTDLAQRLLLEGIAGFAPPEAGSLTQQVALPGWPQRLLIPVATTVGGLLSGLIVYRFAPEAEGHGTDAAISAYHHSGAEVRSRIPLIKAVTSALTIGSGGVAGREGPTAQISVGLGTIMCRLMKVRGQERRSLMLAGMAAGLAAVFRAPLGMAIFSVEILYSGMAFEAEALIYTVIAAVTSYACYGFFTGWGRLFTVPEGLVFQDPAALPGFLLLGVAAGVAGALLPKLLYGVRDLAKRIPGPPHIRPAIGGLCVGLIGVIVPQVLGTGYGWIELAMAGTLPLGTLLLILLLKGPGMALTIGSGGSGGVFAPTVTLGGMLGAVLGLAVERIVPGHSLPVAAYVVVGMAAVFASAARTPISTLIMVAEMTGGYGLIVPAMLANIASFLVQRTLTAGAAYPTLYESQVEGREDSPLHRGVIVRRAMEMIDTGSVEPKDIRLPRLVNLMRYGQPIQIAHTGEILDAIRIEPGSLLDGTTVAEGIGTIEGATAVSVLRDSEIVVPRGATRLQAGDTVLVIGKPEAQRAVREAASRPR
ncbi:MAG: chloride channel protein [Acidobacteria bacterium]|nr:MAG: chloride channel protein [Acidobacteriota bacterium]